MACSHAPASGCATPMSREHSRSATFVPRTSPSSLAALATSSSHEKEISSPSAPEGEGEGEGDN